jgi:hypothetical protein
MIQIKVITPRCCRLHDLCGGMTRDGNSPRLKKGKHDGQCLVIFAARFATMGYVGVHEALQLPLFALPSSYV